jgi:hypothetical protein
LFDRLDEQVDRLLASIDAAANGMGMLLDLQLNQRAYLVSVVATLRAAHVHHRLLRDELRLGWSIGVDTPAAFWLLGLLAPIATAALAWRFLVAASSWVTRRRRGGADARRRVSGGRRHRPPL